jgi:hypothetical protein
MLKQKKMGKDREGTFHPGKGKPSGANKEEGLGLTKNFDPANLERDEQMTERYTAGEDVLSPDVRVRHPNRNTSKGEDFIPSDSPVYKSRTKEQVNDVTNTEPEELLGILTKDMLTELGSYEGDTCISIFLHTHRSGIDVNEQSDLINFKNALQQVEKMLKEKQKGADVIRKLLHPGYELLRNDAFWYNLNEGLGVFISDHMFKYMKLHTAPEQDISIGRSFNILPLLPFIVRDEYFYLLDISKKGARFYRADAFGMEFIPVDDLPNAVDDVVHFENKEDEKLFRTGGKGGTGGANFHGIGSGKPDEKQHVAIYLEEVDDTLWKSHLHNATVPLLLAGVEYLIPIYKSVTDYNNIWPEAITGNHQYEDPMELYKEAIKVMRPYFEKRAKAALEEYGNKSATPLSSFSMEQIIPAAQFSRVSNLFVKKGTKMYGLFNEASGECILTAPEQEGAENLVQRAIVNTYLNGGQVFLLEANEMPGAVDIAAVMRY